MMEIDEVKSRYNAEAKAAMREVLRAKSWEEKVRSIERMNAADKTAKAAMNKTLSQRVHRSGN